MRSPATDLVRRGASFLVTCHIRPDADALGSALGWAAVLRTLGKKVSVYAEGGVPPQLRFLRGSESVLSVLPDEEVWDATFVMDAAAKPLFPILPDSSRTGPVIVVDHHAAHDEHGDIRVRESDACATAVVICRLMDELGVEEVPEESAEPLYAALAADTSAFRSPGTTAETLLLAAELVERGARPSFVATHLFENWPISRMNLLGEVLRAMTLECDKRCAMTVVERAVLEKLGANEDMLEGMVNYGRMLLNVDVSAMIYEITGRNGTEIKVSLRAAEGHDVSKVAVLLGGGGHRGAAGASLAGSLGDARARVLAAIEDYFAGSLV